MAMTDDVVVEERIPQWTLGERMAKARKDAGLTQIEMGSAINVSGAAVARWESDRGRPRDLLATAEEWQRVTGAPVTWLLGLRTGSFSTGDGPDLLLLVNEDIEVPELPFGRDVNERHLEPVE